MGASDGLSPPLGSSLLRGLRRRYRTKVSDTTFVSVRTKSKLEARRQRYSPAPFGKPASQGLSSVDCRLINDHAQLENSRSPSVLSPMMRTFYIRDAFSQPCPKQPCRRRCRGGSTSSCAALEARERMKTQDDHSSSREDWPDLRFGRLEIEGVASALD